MSWIDDRYDRGGRAITMIDYLKGKKEMIAKNYSISSFQFISKQ